VSGNAAEDLMLILRRDHVIRHITEERDQAEAALRVLYGVLVMAGRDDQERYLPAAVKEAEDVLMAAHRREGREVSEFLAAADRGEEP